MYNMVTTADPALWYNIQESWADPALWYRKIAKSKS